LKISLDFGITAQVLAVTVGDWWWFSGAIFVK
jgi:hypothetical protein